MWDEIAQHLDARTGHFELESGNHGSLWFDLELLYRDPRAVRPMAAALAQRLDGLAIDVVCGPLVEGAFVGLAVAEELGVEFTYTGRRVDPDHEGLFPVRYALPGPQRDVVAGRRIAIVNDVINAGSAVRATLADLRECGADVVVIAALLVLGDAADALARDAEVELITFARDANEIWAPDACPMCRDKVALVPHPGS